MFTYPILAVGGVYSHLYLDKAAVAEETVGMPAELGIVLEEHAQTSKAD